ncbi:7tm 7 domain containing protein [Asbolus verrucosus]|uniref:7tm 7 domain containing protein n=1 Tax=Asbolus verrucosus TaxID=1661398 RepID=A0A482W660_ASBVE|nr:7tm 7 domain containing protein [Asbolus verrucosus]
MSFRQLKLVMKVGKFLAVTPDYAETQKTFCQKLHTFFMVGWITAGFVTACVYRYTTYTQFIHMKVVVQLSIDLSLYALNIYTIVTALSKRPQWYRLIRNLKKTQNANKAKSVDIFNDIFGWPLLFITTFTTLQVLIYLQIIFVKAFNTIQLIIYSFSYMFWHCTGTFYNMLLCDAVLCEFEEILAVAHSLEKYFISENRKNEELRKFIKVVKDNFPSFSAARFFNVGKTTVLGISNAIISFLIVMIQFEINQKSGPAPSDFDCTLHCQCNKTKNE